MTSKALYWSMSANLTSRLDRFANIFGLLRIDFQFVF